MVQKYSFLGYKVEVTNTEPGETTNQEPVVDLGGTRITSEAERDELNMLGGGEVGGPKPGDLPSETAQLKAREAANVRLRARRAAREEASRRSELEELRWRTGGYPFVEEEDARRIEDQAAKSHEMVVKGEPKIDSNDMGQTQAMEPYDPDKD